METRQPSRVLGRRPPRSSFEPCNNLRTQHHHHHYPPVFLRQPKIQRGEGLTQGHTAGSPLSPRGEMPPGEAADPSPSLAPGYLFMCCQQPAPPPLHLGQGPGVKQAAGRVGEPSPSHPTSRHSFHLPPGTAHPPHRLGRGAWPPSCPGSDARAELSASLDGPWTHHSFLVLYLLSPGTTSLVPASQCPEQRGLSKTVPLPGPGSLAAEGARQRTPHPLPGTQGPTAGLLWGRGGHCKAMSRENHEGTPGPCPRPSDTTGSHGQNR